MPKLIVLYPPPKDLATFERRYRDASPYARPVAPRAARSGRA